jgi:hypothetical protein
VNVAEHFEAMQRGAILFGPIRPASLPDMDRATVLLGDLLEKTEEMGGGRPGFLYALVGAAGGKVYQWLRWWPEPLTPEVTRQFRLEAETQIRSVRKVS